MTSNTKSFSYKNPLKTLFAWIVIGIILTFSIINIKGIKIKVIIFLSNDKLKIM